MYEAIKNFAEQFKYNPVIENISELKKAKKFVLIGMGGSHLSADILKTWNRSIDLTVRSDYGLPAFSDDALKNSLIIANSYSGNTEEVIDAFNQAMDKKYPLAVISIGGKLIELAKKHNIPYIQMPDIGIQPRLALGFNLNALMKLIGEEQGLKEAQLLADSLKPEDYEEDGKALAKRLKNFEPVIYTSADNLSIAYNWKIKFNETGKIPAFYNVFPELNHNTMTGLDVKESTKELSRKFYFIILKDKDDHLKIQKRMQVLEKLYKDRGLAIEVLEIKGGGKFQKIFSSLILADWTAYYTAKSYGVDPEQVPMVEEFKDLLK